MTLTATKDIAAKAISKNRDIPYDPVDFNPQPASNSITYVFGLPNGITEGTYKMSVTCSQCLEEMPKKKKHPIVLPPLNRNRPLQCIITSN